MPQRLVYLFVFHFWMPPYKIFTTAPLHTLYWPWSYQNQKVILIIRIDFKKKHKNDEAQKSEINSDLSHFYRLTHLHLTKMNLFPTHYWFGDQSFSGHIIIFLSDHRCDTWWILLVAVNHNGFLLEFVPINIYTITQLFPKRNFW